MAPPTPGWHHVGQTNRQRESISCAVRSQGPYPSLARRRLQLRQGHAQQPRRKGSVVPVYEKAIPGPVSVGTRFREVVRLLPFLKGEVISEVTGCDPPHRFDYSFVAFGNMDGE